MGSSATSSLCRFFQCRYGAAFLFFFSLTISSFACGNCQKQSRKKEQFLIKPHVSADLLVPRPSCAFSMFYLHYLLWLWAAATADLLSMGWQAGMGTDGCILESFFKQFCVSIPMSQVVYLTIKKYINDPSSGGARAWQATATQRNAKSLLGCAW